MEKSLKKTNKNRKYSPIFIKETKILNEIISTQETPGPVEFTSELSHAFKKEIATWLHKIYQDIKN